MTQVDRFKLEIKQIVHDELCTQRNEFCKPHEEKIETMEKQLVQIFCNGLKHKIDETYKNVEKLKTQRWTVPIAIMVSILATYFIDKLL